MVLSTQQSEQKMVAQRDSNLGVGLILKENK